MVIWLQTNIYCRNLSSCSGICPCVSCGCLYCQGRMDTARPSLIVGYIATLIAPSQTIKLIPSFGKPFYLIQKRFKPQTSTRSLTFLYRRSYGSLNESNELCGIRNKCYSVLQCVMLQIGPSILSHNSGD
jgi:hypothetical protein